MKVDKYLFGFMVVIAFWGCDDKIHFNPSNYQILMIPGISENKNISEKNVKQHRKISNGYNSYYVKKNNPDVFSVKKNDTTNFSVEKRSGTWWITFKIDDEMRRRFFKFTARNIGKDTLIKINNKILKYSPRIARPIKTNKIEIPFSRESKRVVRKKLREIFSS